MLGKQGAGKGTQCVRLSHHYVIPHISTGDMLRAALKAGRSLGKKVGDAIASGELLADELVVSMVAERLEQDDTRRRGFVLDGFPRTIEQAKALQSLLAPADVDMAVNLTIPTAQVLKRLAGRRVCVDCGANYHVTALPKVDWTCDVCGGEVVQREDDTEDAIRRRLGLYERETAPLIAWYEEHSRVMSISGVGSQDTVGARVIRAVDSYLRRRDRSVRK